MSDHLVELCRLNRRDGQRVLLDDVTFRVAAGQRIGLVGPSGSGKSLLLRSMALLEPIDSGRLLWNGRPVTPPDATAFRSDVMYLHQRPAPFEGSVEEVLQMPFGYRVHRGRTFDESWIVRRLADVGKDRSFLTRRHEQLSGGEMQLVALLRALQLSPSVVLLDEPTAALDPESRRQIEAIVDVWFTESSDRRGLVWVSHDLGQTERMCDRWLRITAGRIETS